MSKIAKKNVGLNVGLNKTEKKVISYLLDDESYSVEDIAKKVDVTKRTIERAFSSLQNKRLIEWIGSKHYGVWHVIKWFNAFIKYFYPIKKKYTHFFYNRIVVLMCKYLGS